MRLLEEALQARSAAQLLDCCLIPRMPEMLTGGRYPTPRHIARSMVNLVAFQHGQKLADLACGSGGLLVAAADLKPAVTGVEISPNWARIAWANLVLHDLPDAEIHIDNAFATFAYGELTQRFDYILINPPFGENVDRSLVDSSLGRNWLGSGGGSQ